MTTSLKTTQSADEKAESRIWTYITRTVLVTWLPIVVTAGWWVVKKDQEQDQRLALVELSHKQHSLVDTANKTDLDLSILKVKSELLEKINEIVNKISERIDKQDQTIRSLPPPDFRADYNEVKKVVVLNNEVLIKFTTKMDLMIDRWNAHMEREAKRSEAMLKDSR